MLRRRQWGILFALIIVGGGILWLLFGREPVQVGRATLRRKAVGDPSKNQLVSLSWQVLEFAASCPNDVRDLPNGFNRPRFSHVTAGPESLSVVLDFSGKPRLCFDGNRDGLLSNEPCFHAKTVQLQPGEPYWRFGPIQPRLRPQENGEPSAFYVSYRVANRNKVQGGSFYAGHLYPAYYRYGRLRLGGRVYQVAVVDGDYDGRFGSVVSALVQGSWQLPQCDVFAIDRDGDGKFEVSRDTQSEVAPLSRLLLLNGKYYAVKVAPDGSSLALVPAEPAQGQLALDVPAAKLQVRLWSDAADQYLSPGATRWNLPVGKYQTLSSVLSLQDPARNEWTFTNATFGELAAFEIRADQTTPVRVGPPFLVGARVKQANREWVAINLSLVGCGGEEYQASVQCNGKRPPEPVFKIVDEKGTVLVADKFQYG